MECGRPRPLSEPSKLMPESQGAHQFSSSRLQMVFIFGLGVFYPGCAGANPGLPLGQSFGLAGESDAIPVVKKAWAMWCRFYCDNHPTNQWFLLQLAVTGKIFPDRPFEK
jgi:hypothetical protein